MSQNWGGGGAGGGWGQGGGGYPPGGAPPGGAPPAGGGGGWGGPPPGGAPQAGSYGPGYTQPGPGFQPPPPGYPPGYTPSPAGGSVAWEDKSRGFFARWWGTVKDVNFNPRSIFAGVAQSEDPWPGITFSVTTGGLVGLVYGILVAIIYLVMGSVIAAALSGLGGKGSTSGAGAMVGMMGVAGVLAAVIYPIYFMFMEFVGPWIGGGINHLCLMLLKGTTKPYTSSVRVSAYSAAAMLWMCVPGLGPIIYLIFRVIALSVGLDETHKCGTGKAVGAVLLPLALFICCCCGFYFIMGAMGAAAAPPRHR